MGTMITWAIIKIIDGENQERPSIANPLSLPELFGVCVYSFMCHHSLPSLITPIQNKKSLFKVCLCIHFLMLMLNGQIVSIVLLFLDEFK